MLRDVRADDGRGSAKEPIDVVREAVVTIFGVQWRHHREGVMDVLGKLYRPARHRLAG